VEIGPVIRRAFHGRLAAESHKALEVFDGAAVEAFGLDLVTQEELKNVRGALARPRSQTMQTFGDEVVAVLLPGHRQIATADDFRLEHLDGELAAEDFVHGGGKDAGFETGGAQDGLLAQGDAFDGKELLGVLGLVESDEIFFEARDFVDFFETDDGVSGRGETMFDGMVRAGHGFGRARSGGRRRGLRGCSPAGSVLFFGDELPGFRQSE